MKVFKGIVSVIAAITLGVTFIAAGFAACLMPPVTHGLSSLFAKDDLSPFDRSQLVRVADATRDYSFSSHDEARLYQTIIAVDREYKNAVEASGGTVPKDFPAVDSITDQAGIPRLKLAFDRASELYCFSEDTVSHLDDCNKIAVVAYPALVAVAAIAVVGLVYCGVASGRRRVGGVLMAAGIVVIVAFAGLGAWAVVDFEGFFRAFHQLFFSQGNWTFPYDSLLICALPTEFWMGMGVIWLAVALVMSALSIVIGRKVWK